MQLKNMENHEVYTEASNSGVKSKDRVKKHGEVFTPDSIVNDMLDLVDVELEKELGIQAGEEITDEKLWDYIHKTYLEPTCGDGNFLVRILDRKLNAARKLPESMQEEALIHSIASIYGIDIQSDNVEESKERMRELIKTGKVALLELDSSIEKNNGYIPFHFVPYTNLSDKTWEVINKILDYNIQCGNALKGENVFIKEYDWTSRKFNTFTLKDIETGNEEPKETSELNSYLDLLNTAQYSDDASFDDF